VIEVDDDPQMLRCPACKATFERETVPEVAALA
jgi:uncharacterized C2H2 Zn-finger protein